ncbi:hypothetical protein PINS_up003753 [Pythium insidiosum]|nr:hypothetical protein PINS_up003753 [Pythium insidiosum]
MAFSTTVDSHLPDDAAVYHPHMHHHHHSHSTNSSSGSSSSSSSSPLASASRKRPAAAPSVRERTVVVFDWDDTLCPSSWLHAQDLLPKFRGQQIDLDKHQQNVLTLIADHVVRLLRKAVSFGPVFVVTAAEVGWVELSCALYLPGVQAVLEMADIHIVSARSWYEQTFGVGGDSSAWKYEVMQLIANKCFGHAAAALQQQQQPPPMAPQPVEQDSDVGFFNFLSIGDSMAERDACHSAADQVPFTLAKTLKFVEQPTTEEIVQQVELTHDSFEQMCGWSSHLDLRLSRAQLAELRWRHSATSYHHQHPISVRAD